MTTTSNREQVTFLSDITIGRRDDCLEVQLKTRTVSMPFIIEAGDVMVDMTAFTALIESDDVSLSHDERDRLLAMMEVATEE